MIRVLVVDDDKLARKGLISLMPWSSYGMEVVGEAANGAKALEFLEHNPVDLMFIDLSMPVLSGIDLIEKVSRLYSDIKFAVLTFHESFEYVQTTLRLGALDYISKLQLEQENLEKILERIRSKMTMKSGPEDSIRNFTDQSFASMEEDWRMLYWLYDESEFERLCEQMAKTSVSVHRIAAFLIHITALAEAATSIPPQDYSSISSPKEAIGFLQKYREEIYGRIARTDRLTDTSVCILKAVLYIREQIASPIHTEAVAGYVNMNRSYFCQCFKKLVGLTFNDYMRQERIRIAKMLLCQTRQTIACIAQAVGYEDIKYFSHVFREQAGQLPSEFRKMFQKADEC